MNFPLFMVSMKCWRHESSGSTFPRAAAMPPSAMTVWALPSRLFVTMPTERPRCTAETAALKPAPPAPIMRTSCSRTSNRSREPFWCPSLCIRCLPSSAAKGDYDEVGYNAGLHAPQVQVGRDQRDEAVPGPVGVLHVKPANEIVRLAPRVAAPNARVAVLVAPDQVAERVA